MRILFGAVAVVAMLASPAAVADDADASTSPVAALDDASFDTQFQCPETIADQDARLDEIQRYQAWAQGRHPDWNLRKRQDVRYGLLRRHACAATLANVVSSTRAPFGP